MIKRLYICDWCGKKEEEHMPCGWIRITAAPLNPFNTLGAIREAHVCRECAKKLPRCLQRREGLKEE